MAARTLTRRRALWRLNARSPVIRSRRPTAWRAIAAGYVVGPAETMPVLRKIGTHTVFSTPTASQIAAQRVLTGPGDAWVTTARGLYAEIGGWAADRLGVRRPDGATFLFLDLAAHLDERGLQGLLEDAAELRRPARAGAQFRPLSRARPPPATPPRLPR